jgi:TetR/AcrR family transcriptional regulator, cholesterol catabolism regulator
MTRRAQQAENRRDQLIDIALHVFAEKGWHATSIPDLAQAAGIAQGLMYHYFRNKEELLQAVIERYSFLPDLQAILAVSDDRPASVVLPEFAQTFVTLLQQNRDLVQIFFQEAQTYPEIAQQRDALIERGVTLLTEYVSARIASGELRSHEPSLSVRMLLYTIFMSQIIHVSGEVDVSAVVQLLLQGIGRQEELVD